MLANLRNLTVTIETGNVAIHDTFGSYYANTTVSLIFRHLTVRHLLSDDITTASANFDERTAAATHSFCRYYFVLGGSLPDIPYVCFFVQLGYRLCGHPALDEN